MDPTIHQPFLTPRQGELLTALYSHRLDLFALAAHEQLSYYELERFTAAIQPHLAILQSFLELTLPLRTLAARFATLTHLEEAAKTAQNPTEKRLAASALLRAISSPSTPRRETQGPQSLGSTETKSTPRSSARQERAWYPPESPPEQPRPNEPGRSKDTSPQTDPPDPDATLSHAYRAAAAAIRDNDEPAITHPANPTRTPPSSRHSGLGTRHFSAAANLLSRAGQAPITTLEPLARPP